MFLLTRTDSQPASPLDDETELVERAKQDPEAFGVLYERYVTRIYRYLYYRTGNHQDAEDLTARTFYRALEHLSRYQVRGLPFVAWLYRIAHNVVANWLRDRSRRPVIALDSIATWGSAEEDPQSALEGLEEREMLLAAFRSLPPERQELLILKFVEGMPNAQIGAIMGRSEGAIKSLYHRTLVELRKYLEGSDDGGARDHPDPAR